MPVWSPDHARLCGYVCSMCGHEQAAGVHVTASPVGTTVHVQRKLAIQGGPPTKRIHRTEEAVEKEVRAGLDRAGWTWLITSRRQKWLRCRYRDPVTSRWCNHRQRAAQCPKCKQPLLMADPRDGASKGLPDILVWSPRRKAWIGAELKSSRGSVSPEQKELRDHGMTTVCRSWAELENLLAEEKTA